MSKENVAKKVFAGVEKKLTDIAVDETEHLVNEQLIQLGIIEKSQAEVSVIKQKIKDVAAKLAKKLEQVQ